MPLCGCSVDFVIVASFAFEKLLKMIQENTKHGTFYDVMWLLKWSVGVGMVFVVLS